MALDACARSVKARVKVWPSARASQMVAKSAPSTLGSVHRLTPYRCRKAHGHVRKSAAGKSLRRWGKEKWRDVRTGKPCGSDVKNEYCRPTKRVSKKTPTMRPSAKKVCPERAHAGRQA